MKASWATVPLFFPFAREVHGLRAKSRPELQRFLPAVVAHLLRYSRPLPPTRPAGDDMTNQTSSDGLRARISKQSEDALGRLAQELLESPIVSGALTRAFDAREKAAAAQEVAMGALNLPSAADLEKLTRRVRSVSQRLEAIEDLLDRVEQRIGALGTGSGADDRLAAIEQRLDTITTQLAYLGEQVTPTASQPVITSAASRRPAASRTRAAAARRRTARRVTARPTAA
jgi:hypothetical protein